MKRSLLTLLAGLTVAAAAGPASAEDEGVVRLGRRNAAPAVGAEEPGVVVVRGQSTAHSAPRKAPKGLLMLLSGGGEQSAAPVTAPAPAADPQTAPVPQGFDAVTPEPGYAVGEEPYGTEGTASSAYSDACCPTGDACCPTSDSCCPVDGCCGEGSYSRCSACGGDGCSNCSYTGYVYDPNGSNGHLGDRLRGRRGLRSEGFVCEHCGHCNGGCQSIFGKHAAAYRARKRANNERLSAYLHCKLGYFIHDGAGGVGAPPFGHYSIVYADNPNHFDGRDSQVYAAQGYGGPVSVPLAPNVRHTYNYGWGIPSSRLTPVSNAAY